MLIKVHRPSDMRLSTQSVDSIKSFVLGRDVRGVYRIESNVVKKITTKHVLQI